MNKDRMYAFYYAKMTACVCRCARWRCAAKHGRHLRQFPVSSAASLGQAPPEGVVVL